MEELYRINDVLTALAEELGIQFPNDETKDEVLDSLTHKVAEAFGFRGGLT